MKRKTSLLILVVAVMIAAGPVAAIPFGETDQTWNFDNNSNPAIPEIDLNPYGTATAAITGSASVPPPEWAADLLGRDGVWQAQGILTITLNIPNQMIANPYKEIRLEMGFIGDGDLADFSVIPIPFVGSVELVSQEIVVVDPATGWKKLTAYYIIEPNPDWEFVCYSFSGALAAIDYAIVNTKCVPEPMTVSLLGLGGLILARRKR